MNPQRTRQHLCALRAGIHAAGLDGRDGRSRNARQLGQPSLGEFLQLANDLHVLADRHRDAPGRNRFGLGCQALSLRKIIQPSSHVLTHLDPPTPPRANAPGRSAHLAYSSASARLRTARAVSGGCPTTARWPGPNAQRTRHPNREHLQSPRRINRDLSEYPSIARPPRVRTGSDSRGPRIAIPAASSRRPEQVPGKTPSHWR